MSTSTRNAETQQTSTSTSVAGARPYQRKPGYFASALGPSGSTFVRIRDVSKTQIKKAKIDWVDAMDETIGCVGVVVGGPKTAYDGKFKNLNVTQVAVALPTQGLSTSSVHTVHFGYDNTWLEVTACPPEYGTILTKYADALNVLAQYETAETESLLLCTRKMMSAEKIRGGARAEKTTSLSGTVVRVRDIRMSETKTRTDDPNCRWVPEMTDTVGQVGLVVADDKPGILSVWVPFTGSVWNYCVSWLDVEPFSLAPEDLTTEDKKWLDEGSEVLASASFIVQKERSLQINWKQLCRFLSSFHHDASGSDSE